jgi:hypothetical protein
MGDCVLATCSQARAVTWARSRGGEGGLAPPAGSVFELEGAFGPALAPEADGVGVEADLGSGLDVGEFGLVVQQQGQLGALPQVGRRGAAALERPGSDEELAGEAGLIQR